jgi:hypothetical protein
MERKIPKNVRQIGNVSDSLKIYVEDYVDTYLNQLCEKEAEIPVGAFLIGDIVREEELEYQYIYGAIQMEELGQDENGVFVNEETWRNACEVCQTFFENGEIIGWFAAIPGIPFAMNGNLKKVHQEIFAKDKGIFILKDPVCKDEMYFAPKFNDLMQMNGHYIYYEKNPGMQTYMIDKNEELQPEPQEKYEDQAVKDFRKIIADKKETRKEPAAPSVFSYGLTACLAIAVLTVGVNFYRSYQNVKQNEKESATVSSVIVEEITPSPVVGTSNNEAVRQHKQYRTDTIQNDAGKNKKNNEENNQSTSEKENSEKKNNTSEKKISAEQTDTEQKSDKTEQLPDVKTEKADKTEQIYQQEADERKAQKRVREAVQKENSEAAGKAHESYVIQPGDTLFQISMDRYGSIEAISQICKLNGMSADEIIYPGQVIVLP